MALMIVSFGVLKFSISHVKTAKTYKLLVQTRAAQYVVSASILRNSHIAGRAMSNMANECKSIIKQLFVLL